MKFKKIIAVTLLATTLLFTGCSKKDSVALKIGDQEISYGLYNEYLAMFENVAKIQYGEEALAQEINGQTLKDVLKESLVERLTVQELVEIHMLENGFVLDEAKVKEEVTKLKELVEADATMKEVYENSKVTDAFYEMQVTQNLVSEAFQAWLKAEVEKDPEYKDKIAEAYNTQEVVKARHILVAGEGPALEIKAQIERGDDTFENLAKIHSGDPGSKEKGGDLGYFARGEMVPTFDDVAFSLEIGKISDPVATDYGYHLILVEDRKTIQGLIDSGAEDSVLEPLKQSVLNPYLNAFYEKLMTSLKEKHPVENFIVHLDAENKDKSEDKKEPAKEEVQDAEANTEAPAESGDGK